MKYSITQLFPGTKSMLYIGLTAVLMVGSGCEKEEQKLGVVEVRRGNGVSYALYVVKQAPDIPPYEVIMKAWQSGSLYGHNEYVYHPDKSVSDLGYTQKPTKDDEGYYDQIQEDIGGKYSSHFYASKPGANGWWGTSGGAGTGGGGNCGSSYQSPLSNPDVDVQLDSYCAWAYALRCLEGKPKNDPQVQATCEIYNEMKEPGAPACPYCN